MEVKAFLFDLDGVIIDSERHYTTIWEAIESAYPTGVENFAKKIKGTTLEDILSQYYPDVTIREKVEELLYKMEAEMTYCYKPGSREFLEILKERNIPMALVTSSNSEKMIHLYKDIPEIKNYFESIIVGDMVHHSKPDPEGYIMAAQKLGIAPTDCAVVEDSLQGIRAGKNAGATVIGVSGTLPLDDIKDECDIVVDNLCDINI